MKNISKVLMFLGLFFIYFVAIAFLFPLLNETEYTVEKFINQHNIGIALASTITLILLLSISKESVNNKETGKRFSFKKNKLLQYIFIFIIAFAGISLVKFIFTFNAEHINERLTDSLITGAIFALVICVLRTLRPLYIKLKKLMDLEK